MTGLKHARSILLVLIVPFALMLYSCFSSNLLGQTFRVFYNGNGNTGGLAPVDNSRYFPGQEVRIRDFGSLARKGYDINGWAPLPSATGSPYQNKFPIYSDTELYAQWYWHEYLVTYSAEGSTSGSPPPTEYFRYGSATPVNIPGAGSMIGPLTFAGWMTARDGSGASYASPYPLYPEPGDISFYPIWYSATEFILTASGSSVIFSTYSGSSTDIIIPVGVTEIGAGVLVNRTTLNSVVIPASVKIIGNAAFNNCSSLTSVIIPDGVTSIGDTAFSYCMALSSIRIPGSVKTIGASAFNGCSGLASIEFNEGLESIMTVAFSSCTSLTFVTIPASVNAIGTSAFSSCSSLRDVYMLSTVPPALPVSSNAFVAIVPGFAIHVPAGCANAYKTATGWSDYASYIVE